MLDLWQVLLSVLGSRKEGDFETIITYRALAYLELPKFLEKVKAGFIEAATEVKNDKAALAALRILYRICELSFGSEEAKERRRVLIKTLQDFYWLMPYGEETGCDFLPIMEKSKEFIIQAIVWEWKIVNSHSLRELDHYARELLRFISDCYNLDIPKQMAKLNEATSMYGKRALREKYRVIFKKNQEMIEKVIRDATKDISFENLKLWLEEKCLPDGLAKIFGIAWARNGGYLELTK